MTPPSHSPEPEQATLETARRPSRKLAWGILKWALFGLVLVFVCVHAWRLWHSVDTQAVSIRWTWLAAATAVSIVGWFPSVWYWRWVMATLGAPAPLWPVARAYYGGHLGKYVPGKATVLVVRAGMLRSQGVSGFVAAFGATLESLTYMAAGAATAVALLPQLLGPESRFAEQMAYFSQSWRGIVLPIVVAAASVVGLFVLSSLSIWLAARLKWGTESGPRIGERIPVRVFFSGFLVFLLAWWLQGAVVGLTLQAISPEPVDWRHWPAWTGTASIALVGGFLAIFAPGGLGVREGLLMELLQYEVGPQDAVLAAVLLRGVSLAGELLAAGSLWSLVRTPKPRS